MDFKPGYPDGLLFIGLALTGPPVFMTSPAEAAAWMAVDPGQRRVWRTELCEQTAMEFVPPGEPTIREKVSHDR